MEIDIDNEDLADHEREILSLVMDVVGGDVPRVLDALHQLSAKVGAIGEITTDSLVAGQARHAALLAGRN